MKVEDIEAVAVIGAGTMGPEIAQVCGQTGYQVKITDKKTQLLPEALEEIKSNLQTLSEMNVLPEEKIESMANNIATTGTLEETVEDADLVFEAITEDLETKKQLFKDLCRLCPSHTILATNTSSLSITEIAKGMSRGDKIIGAHWWNPPSLMPLVEIVRSENTSNETVKIARNFIKKLEKVPVTCKDVPGFLGVRLQSALINEAVVILEEGIASKEDIDMAVKKTLGLRLPILGPLEIIDLGGLDTFLYAYEYMGSKLGPRYEPPNLLKGKVEANELGIKSGKGIYDYEDEDIDEIIQKRNAWLIEQLKKSKGSENE